MPASPRRRLDQYGTLKSYERLVAPFDGRVTARFADPGALVQNATTSQTAAQPVVTISDDTRLRIDAYVQQDVAPFVHEGDTAEIVDAANTGRSITAKITRVAGQLDPRTRTMLVEVVLDNRERFLLGGSFAYLTLHVPVNSATQVPVGALITRGNDQFVAMVGPDSRLHYIKVAVASTDGDTVTWPPASSPAPAGGGPPRRSHRWRAGQSGPITTQIRIHGYIADRKERRAAGTGLAR